MYLRDRARNLRRALVGATVALVVVALSLVGAAPLSANSATLYVGSANSLNHDGYWMVTAAGSVRESGSAGHFGDMSGGRLNAPVISIASTASGNGYWLVGADGGIFSFGDARFFGSTGAMRLNQPIVGMAATASGNGYWLVARDGGIFTFGDARFFGSTGAMHLNQPIVGMAANSKGDGYWLVAADGGIFTFGSAEFFGSTGALKLNRPIVSMSPTKSDKGYWLAGADGGIFTFGDAVFAGSSPQQDNAAIAVVADAAGGYSLVRSDGSVDSHSLDESVSERTGWTLRDQEHFDGVALNQKRWPLYDGMAGGGFGRYTPSRVGVSNGSLTIDSVGSSVGGTCWCDGGGSYTYGKWEIRARMSNSARQWPALLLWPESERWPIDGEIDIAEFESPVRNGSTFTVHYGADNKQIAHTSAGDFTQWHTFGVDWQPGYIKYYLDGALQFTVTEPAAIPHTPMHLAIQTNAGNSAWLGTPLPGTTSKLEVDWVKMYR